MDPRSILAEEEDEEVVDADVADDVVIGDEELVEVFLTGDCIAPGPPTPTPGTGST